MKNSQKSLSIKATIILLFITVMAVAAIVIGSLIFTRWFSSAEQTIERIAQNVTTDIHDRIQRFMEIPIQINEVNHKIIENEILDLSDEIRRDRFFVGVLTSQHEQIYSFSYGTSNGEYYGARRNEAGVIEIMKNNASTGGSSWYYLVNDDLTAGELSIKLGQFDPRTRTWYKVVENTGRHSFSPLYKHFIIDDLTVSAAWPIYDGNKVLQGVLGTHMLLSDIGSYLEKAVKDYDGYALIFEKETGYLVATSTQSATFTMLQDNTLNRHHISEIEHVTLNNTYENYLKHQSDLQFVYKSGDERLYAHVSELHLDGVDWVVLSAIPGNFLFSHLFDSMFLTIILIFLAFSLAIVMHYLITQRLLNPIDDLLQVAADISAGDLTKRVKIVRNDEIGSISRSFNSVAENLEFLVHNLESSVEERTEAFLAANVELEENKNSLQLLLDSTAEGIYGIDLNGDCTFCNLSAIKLLGYSDQKELLGKNMHQQMHHSFPDCSSYPADECNILQSIKRGKGFSSDEEVFWRADHTSFNVAYYSYPQISGDKITGGVVTFMDITENKHQEEQIEYLRCHDPLTGLNNRGCFEEHYANLDVIENLPISVIFADLNGLKMTNDIFGHAAGDELIKTAAHILKKSCRKGDIAARVGGDEFMIVLPNTQKAQADAIMTLISNEFNELRIEAIQCSISLGSATKTSLSETLENVIADAENEMYKNKSKNRKTGNKKMVDTIQEALHAKSPREAQHSIFIRDACRELGLALNLSETEISKLQRTAYVHDIGKIILDKELFTKDWLSDEEFEQFKQHPVVGFRILNLFDDTLDIAEYVYSHHEKWDGSGYPRGLRGEQIPYLSRILSIMETYERVYERGICSVTERKQNAIQVIREGAGTQFDAHIAQVFVQLLNNVHGDYKGFFSH